VYITNSHVTEREVGDKLDYLGTEELDVLHRGSDLVNRQGVSRQNHLIKSSTFHIKGETYHFALGINYDYTNMHILDSVVGDLIEEAVEFVGKPMLYMHKQDRVEMIRYLNEKGTFSIHKSIPFIACKMNVSRYTVYNYIREIKE